MTSFIPKLEFFSDTVSCVLKETPFPYIHWHSSFVKTCGLTFSSNASLSLLEYWRHSHEWIVCAQFPSIVHCSHLTDANTKTHPFVRNNYKYFPKVRDICVRKAFFYQRTGCSDKLNILRIIIGTYQCSPWKPSALHWETHKPLVCLHCLSNCPHTRDLHIGSVIYTLWETEIYIIREMNEMFMTENFKMVSMC